MSRTLQIMELMINEMEKNPGRYRVEITSEGICIADCKELFEGTRVMPDYHFFHYEPKEDYQIECNRMFEEFIGGLKA